VTVRAATAGDAAALAALLDAVGWTRGEPAGEVARRWGGLVADPDWWIGVTDDGGAPVGVATVKPSASHPGAGHVSYVVVAPDRQGQGIGAALMDAAAAEMRARGYDRGRLRVPVAGDRARALYERLGWADTGVRVFDPAIGLDMAEYELPL
jgi:ribosomal protein S18 acetylase RimI-like enzyme